MDIAGPAVNAGCHAEAGVLMIALSLYSGFTALNVDNAAHVGGLGTGFLAGIIVCLIRKYRNREVQI